MKISNKNIIWILVIFVLFFISIGYSYLETIVNINGSISISREIKGEKEVTILGQKMVAYKDNMQSPYVTDTKGIDFTVAPSDTNGKGLYLKSGTESDEYPIVYYRGEVNNNHVLFGGFCWKIVRTTEKGGTKLIYDGIPSSNRCNNTGTSSQLSTTTAFNSNYDSLSDVGYMYGARYSYTTWNDTSYIYGTDVSYGNGVYTLTDISSLDTIQNIKTKHYTCRLTTTGTCSKVYYVYRYYNNTAYAIELTGGSKLEDIISNSFKNTNDSSIKKIIDNWFASNLASKESKLEDAVWCSDRTIASGGYAKDGNAASNAYFRAYPTMFEPEVKDELACPRKDDRYTKSDTVSGNGVLKYPVGMLTAYETTLAGHGWRGYSNASYLYTGENYWLMTPYCTAAVGYFGFVFYTQNNGNLSLASLDTVSGIRPSIVLKGGTVATSGDGTSAKPYVVN